MRSVVLLPAPFGPRKPVTRPDSTANDRSLTASTLPKRLLRPSNWMAVELTGTTYGISATLEAAHLGGVRALGLEVVAQRSEVVLAVVADERRAQGVRPVDQEQPQPAPQHAVAPQPPHPPAQVARRLPDGLAVWPAGAVP